MLYQNTRRLWSESQMETNADLFKEIMEAWGEEDGNKVAVKQVEDRTTVHTSITDLFCQVDGLCAPVTQFSKYADSSGEKCI